MRSVAWKNLRLRAPRSWTWPSNSSRSCSLCQASPSAGSHIHRQDSHLAPRASSSRYDPRGSRKTTGRKAALFINAVAVVLALRYIMASTQPCGAKSAFGNAPVTTLLSPFLDVCIFVLCHPLTSADFSIHLRMHLSTGISYCQLRAASQSGG
jgi:hypothetical protein